MTLANSLARFGHFTASGLNPSAHNKPAPHQSSQTVSIYNRDPGSHAHSGTSPVPDYKSFYESAMNRFRTDPRLKFRASMVKPSRREEWMQKQIADAYYLSGGEHPHQAVWAQPGRSKTDHDQALFAMGLDPNRTYTKDQVAAARTDAMHELAMANRRNDVSTSLQLRDAIKIADAYYGL